MIGIVLVGMVLISRAGSASRPLPSDPAELAGYVFFNLAMIAAGVVLIVIGARIKSRNNKADIAARQQAQYGWQPQPGPYAHQPAQQPGQHPGPYAQQPGQQPGAYDQQPGQPGPDGQQPGRQAPSGPYGQPWQPGPSGAPQPPATDNPRS